MGLLSNTVCNTPSSTISEMNQFSLSSIPTKNTNIVILFLSILSPNPELVGSKNKGKAVHTPLVMPLGSWDTLLAGSICRDTKLILLGWSTLPITVTPVTSDKTPS